MVHSGSPWLVSFVTLLSDILGVETEAVSQFDVFLFCVVYYICHY